MTYRMLLSIGTNLRMERMEGSLQRKSNQYNIIYPLDMRLRNS